MEDFEQEQDGLPVFTKKPAQQVTEEGLPILKKKEPTQDGGKTSAPNSPSTSISSLGPGADLASGAVLKTIQPNTENVSINENVVTPIQNKPGRSKSVIDRDIDMSLNFSLKNPALTKTKDKIDLSTPNPNQQPGLSMPFDQEVAVQKRQITSDPQLLKEYGQTRMKQIGETINQFNTAADDASKTYLGDKTLYADNENSIALKTKAKELEDYQNQFRDSLKTQAAISVTGKALQLGQQLDPIQIGREVLDVISDPTLKDDERVLAELKNPSDQYFLNPHGGVEVSKNIYDIKAADKTAQNINYNLYKTGADAMKLYWSDAKDKIYNESPVKIDTFTGLINQWNDLPKVEQNNPGNPINIQLNALKNDPDLQNYIAASNEYSKADETSVNAIKQFPQVERLNKIQRLNDAFFAMNEVKDVTTGAIREPQKVWKLLFGATPSKEDVPELSKLSGVDEKQVKELIDEGGFFSDIPYNVRLNGLFQGVARGAAETLDQTAMGIRRFTDPNSSVTETRNRMTQDALSEKGIMSQRNKLQDDQGKWNINPMSIANIMGYGLGQTSIQAFPALLTGGVATEGSLAERAIETVSTVIPGAAASYESAYKTAAASTEDESVRKAYAFLNSLANGAAELLYSPADIAKKTSSILFPKKAIGKEMVNAFMEDVAKKGLDKTVTSGIADIGKKIWGVVKEPANVLLAENIEEQATNLATNTLDEKMLGIKRNQAELADQAFSTFIQTTFQTLPLALGVGIGGNQDMSGVRKQALFEVGKQPDLFKTLAQEWLDNGRINQSQFNQKVSQINQLQNIVSSLPSKDSKGKNLSYEDLSELAAQQFRIDTNEKKIKEGALAGELPLIEADTKEAIQKQTDILNKEEVEAPAVSEEANKAEIIFPVRNNDFAEKYFSKEAPEGQESEFDVWNRLKNEDPQAASEMVQNKKDELTKATEETVSTAVSKEEGMADGLKTVESFKTSKGSVYTVGEDGRTTRFKSATNEQKEPQDLTVFSKFEGQQQDDYLQAIHGYNGESVHVVGILDGKVQEIFNNEDASNATHIKLTIVDKDGKIVDKIEALTYPKKGYNPFDQRQVEENKYEKHIGNEVSEINYKNETIQTEVSKQPEAEKPISTKTEEKVSTPVSKEEVVPPENEITVGEMIDKSGSYKGEKGIFYQDGQSIVFKVNGKNKEYELGNIDEIKNGKISDYGISHEESIVGIDKNGEILVRGKVYKNNYSNPIAAINYNENGDVVSVNLDTDSGSKRTFRGNVAEDIAYQIQLKQISKNNETRNDFEKFINEDEKSIEIFNNSGFDETSEKEAVASDEKIQREKIGTVATLEGQKLETINEGGQNDSTNQQGVSGEVREGQEPVQTQLNEGTSGEETGPGGNVQTPEGQEEIDHDYIAREQSVRDYAKESGIELDEEETDLATGLVGEADSVKDAVDFVVQDRINNSVQPLYTYIQEIKSDKIRNREKQKLVDEHFDDIVTQLVTNKKIRKEC